VIKVCVLGANNPHTRMIIDAIEEADRLVGEPRYAFNCAIDGNPAKQGPDVFDWDAVPPLIRDGYVFANEISGSTRARWETSKRVTDLGGYLIDLIWPGAARERINGGRYIQEDVRIQAGCEVGDWTTIHSGALLSHQTRVRKCCFVGPRATICGRVTLGYGVYVGAAATILPDVKVGAWATIGAGAVVLKDVPPGCTVVGNPSHIIKVDPVA
jgi:hypothetical protein